MKTIDCRGLACPAPVVSTKKALEKSGGAPFRMLLDNGAARENVLRFCRSKGCAVDEKTEDGSMALTITAQYLSPAADPLPGRLTAPVILITSDSMGNSSDDLGRLLLKNFIITLLELQSMPEKIIFVNRGVLLTSAGSELVEPLNRLVNAGVEIMSCGVCLEYFGIRDKLLAGEVTNMYTIAESLLSCGNTVRL